MKKITPWSWNMKELVSIVNLFYTGFLLRDIAGKVVPGAILSIAVLESCIGLTRTMALSKDIPGTGWVLVFAIFWVIGLTFQSIGVWCSVVKYSIIYPDNESFFEALLDFHSTNQSDTNARRLERFMAIREAYGNTAVSVCVSYILWLLISLTLKSNDFGLIIVMLMAAAAAAYFLHLGHIETINNQDKYWSLSIKRNKEEDEKKKL